MKLLLAVDSHVYRTPDNKYWCKGITGYDFFARYLSGGFTQVDVMARVLDVNYETVQNYLQADGNGVSFIDLPFARGSKEYLLKFFAIRKKISKHISNYNHAIFRLPSILSFLVLQQYSKQRKVYYGVELVADCYESFKNKKIMQWYFTKLTKKYCANANGMSYVTEEYLQNFYPSFARINGSDAQHFETYYSSISLSEEFIGKQKFLNKDKEIIITHISNKTNATIKGQDILIKALKLMIDSGINARIVFIGDSEIKEYYFGIAKSLDVDDRIIFTGMISDKNVIRDYLLNSEIYIFPTISEGLPRSVIEAMAVGLPCIATAVGGIPELIESKYLVQEQSDFNQFAKLAIQLLTDENEYSVCSEYNLEKSKSYLEDKLNMKRMNFYKKIMEL